MKNETAFTLLNSILRKVRVLKVNMASLPINRDTIAMHEQIKEIDDLVTNELMQIHYNKVV